MPDRARWGLQGAWVVLAVLAAACSRAGTLGDLRYFPGATTVGSTSFVAEVYGFPEANWVQVELRTQAAFERVRDFYAQMNVRGWTSTFEHEVPKSTGWVYARYLADARRHTFYVIIVEERERVHDVSVLLRRGLARQ